MFVTERQFMLDDMVAVVLFAASLNREMIAKPLKIDATRDGTIPIKIVAWSMPLSCCTYIMSILHIIARFHLTTGVISCSIELWKKALVIMERTHDFQVNTSYTMQSLNLILLPSRFSPNVHGQAEVSLP